MKTLKPKSQMAVLRAAVKDWSRATSKRKFCRLIFSCAPTARDCAFTEQKIRLVLHHLMLAGGCWGLAIEYLRDKLSADSLAKLRDWHKAVKGGAL
jgi:hypothetical protein